MDQDQLHFRLIVKVLTLSLLVATFVVYILISFANSLDSDQDGQNVGSDLDQNHVTDSVPERIC